MQPCFGVCAHAATNNRCLEGEGRRRIGISWDKVLEHKQQSTFLATISPKPPKQIKFWAGLVQSLGHGQGNLQVM